MPAITGNEIVTDALGELNVFLAGESVPAADGAMGLRYLNRLLNSLKQRRQFIPLVSRNRFHTMVNQGGPDTPYTIGPGGNFNTTRPANQNAIESANLILTSTTPEVRVPLGIYTTQAYDANQLPGMTNTQPTGLYYNPTYDQDLGLIFLWPVPSVAYNDLELFLWQSVTEFADLSTTYYVPDGWPEFLHYNLARRLQTPCGRTLNPEAKQLAISTMGVIMRANTQLSDLMNDAYLFTYNRRTLYNINTGAPS